MLIRGLSVVLLLGAVSGYPACTAEEVAITSLPDSIAQSWKLCPGCRFPRCLCGCPAGGDCGSVCEEVYCPLCHARHLPGMCGRLACRETRCIEVGPPAVRYRPPHPPEFLPVPTQPVTANVNMQPLPEVRGTADIGPGNQILFPAHRW